MRPRVNPCGTPAERTRVIAFLGSIGLPVSEVPSVGHSFLEGVRIRAGALEVAPEAGLDALLHEAGHLAVTPQPFRSWLDGDIEVGLSRMFRAIADLDIDPDSPLARASLHCDEQAATAWAWAAGCHLGLAPEVVILDSSYEGDGPQIRAMLQRNAYAGINVLAHAGMCVRGMLAVQRGLEPYPRMLDWVQPIAGPPDLPMPPSRCRVRP